jgi:ABC-type transport system involved in cytochrome c biogenesis permease component
MTRETLRTRRPVTSKKYNKRSMIISNILLISGSLIIVSPLVYLLLNLDKSDSLVSLMMPFIYTGIGLLIVSQVICPFQFKKRR